MDTTRTAFSDRLSPFGIMGGVLWRRKYILLAVALAVSAIGAVYAFNVSSVYGSKAILTPKKSGSGAGTPAILSQLGRLGMAAGSLGMANTSLTVLQVLLQSPEVVENVITNGALMPRMYPDKWDSKAMAWRPKAKAPTLRSTIEHVRNEMIVVEADPKRDLITLHVLAGDSNLAPEMVSMFLTELENKIQRDVRSEAKKNYEFLESQLSNTPDPLLREKIQGLMAAEIEKSMLVSSATFEVLETPQIPLFRMAPKRKRILVLSFLMGLIISSAIVLLLDPTWRDLFLSGRKT